jgi:hypothetical protein
MGRDYAWARRLARREKCRGAYRRIHQQWRHARRCRVLSDYDGDRTVWQRKAVTGQPPCKQTTSPCQSRSESRRWTAKLLCRLLDGFPFQFTEDDGGPIDRRQGVQLLVQQRVQLFPGFVAALWPGSRCRFLLLCRALDAHGSCLQCSAVSDPVQPITDHASRPNRCRLADQDEERGLKSILRISLIPENAPANAQHHRPVPLDQSCESVGGVSSDENFQKFPVCKTCLVVATQGIAKLAQNCCQPGCCHRDHPLNPTATYTSPGQASVFSRELAVEPLAIEKAAHEIHSRPKARSGNEGQESISVA